MKKKLNKCVKEFKINDELFEEIFSGDTDSVAHDKKVSLVFLLIF